ncbi:MAG: hypothetical protein IKG82_08200, partial [Oscillospiraceae bacterium]|nr:hypothetical protein [Oscillospiraceae bacterium]
AKAYRMQKHTEEIRKPYKRTLTGFGVFFISPFFCTQSGKQDVYFLTFPRILFNIKTEKSGIAAK